MTERDVAGNKIITVHNNSFVVRWYMFKILKNPFRKRRLLQAIKESHHYKQNRKYHNQKDIYIIKHLITLKELNSDAFIEFPATPLGIQYTRHPFWQKLLDGTFIQGTEIFIQQREDYNPFTDNGVEHYKKGWYSRLKEKWYAQFIIDVFAIIGFAFTMWSIFNNR